VADDKAETMRLPEAAATLESTPGRAAETAGGGEATRPTVQRAVDNILSRALLWAIPTWVKPNHVTVLRLLFIPAILLLLHFDHRIWALVLFSIAIWTDPIDGAMARTRGQTSTFGTYVDPIADKLLIAAVLAWVGWDYLDGHPAIGLVVPMFLAFIVLELVVTSVGVPMLVRTRTTQASNAFGKAKMFIQCLALFLFLLAGILALDRLTKVSLYMLWVALALAVVSGGKQILDVIRKKPERAP
jgi:CDP-diacylglycerol--glycerol-3-phosphate 3-phosphatidyltransferase